MDQIHLDSDYHARFNGVRRLYGVEKQNKIRKAKVLIIGLGGVGSWAAESLARTGIGSLCLVDLDDLCISNINRQIHALSQTIGDFKVDVMKKRIKAINPSCKVEAVQSFLSQKNIEEIFKEKFDYVIDACDDFKNKCLLIDYCYQKKIKLIVAGGAGGKTNPLMIEISDLSFSAHDKLLARVRKKLRADHNFPKDPDQNFNIWSVWSRERALYPTEDGCVSYSAPGSAKNMDCKEGFGSVSYLTGAFAFAMCSHVIKEIGES